MKHSIAGVQQGDTVCIEASGAFSIEILSAGNAPSSDWVFPVNDPETWYCAVWHDLTGRKNGGYRHTGIDLNLDKSPWGDVDRGQPVFAVAAGTVTASASSSGWLGVVQIRHEHRGAPLYVRYAHLERLAVTVGDIVRPGQLLGFIGNWTGGDGGDHLHFDAATDPFYWGAWLQSSINWVDPVEILREHLDGDTITAMLSRK